MPGAEFAFVILLFMLAMVFAGFHIVVALGVASVVGIGVVTGSAHVALSLLSSTAFEALRDYIFAVIPLFVLLGEMVSRSGAAADLYLLMNRALRRVPGRLAVATVAGNAVFAAVVGVSIASAAAFTRIAYPQMMRQGYDKGFALGCIAGSASLGMLIPPSALMIVWGVLTEQSIGKLFIAGILPGLLLAGMYAGYCVITALTRPRLVGVGKFAAPSEEDLPIDRRTIIGGVGTAMLIVIVLGGIWFGAFTPTEAAGIGALLAIVLAAIKGLTLREMGEAVLETGRTSAPLLFLLIFAQMYARLLAYGGVVDGIQETILGLGLEAWTVLVVMLVIWLVLGMFIDSASIMLLTVPIFAPIADQFGFHPYAFAIMGILAIEAGILTPPLGLCVYTVKACLPPGDDVSLGRIFYASTPYWVLLIVLMWIVYAFPGIATWLPSL
jgi:tripartite ATP-independent transporter DctM subunit